MSTITRPKIQVAEVKIGSAGCLRTKTKSIGGIFKAIFGRKRDQTGMSLSKKQFEQWKVVLSGPRQEKPRLKKLLSERSVFE